MNKSKYWTNTFKLRRACRKATYFLYGWPEGRSLHTICFYWSGFKNSPQFCWWKKVDHFCWNHWLGYISKIFIDKKTRGARNYSLIFVSHSDATSSSCVEISLLYTLDVLDMLQYEQLSHTVWTFFKRWFVGM